MSSYASKGALHKKSPPITALDDGEHTCYTCSKGQTRAECLIFLAPSVPRSTESPS